MTSETPIDIASPDNSTFWQQLFKWVVYGLLTVNFAFYFYDDWTITTHTISDNSTFDSILSGFATSLAVFAWILLLLLLELETYLLEDNQFTKWRVRIMHGVRALCVLTIGYSMFAFGDYVVDLLPTVDVEEETTSLCDLADRELSYTYNVEYTEITSENCGELSTQDKFFWVDGTEVITDAAGLQLERWLAWGDLVEVIAWMVILISIEVVVRLQDRGITQGVVMTSLGRTKTVGYIVLFGLAIWWGTLGHGLYVWDTLLWIGGFIAIEGNLKQWRDEMKEESNA